MATYKPKKKNINKLKRYLTKTSKDGKRNLPS